MVLSLGSTEKAHGVSGCAHTRELKAGTSFSLLPQHVSSSTELVMWKFVVCHILLRKNLLLSAIKKRY